MPEAAGAAAGPVGALGRLARALFSPSFPFVLVTLCGVSFLLGAILPTPEFGYWAFLSIEWWYDAQRNLWLAIALAALAVAALPLMWIAVRQRRSRAPNLRRDWGFAAAVVIATALLRVVWPYHDSDPQILVYSFLLFIGWNAVVDAAIGTLAVVGRPKRPPSAEQAAEPKRARG